MAVNTSAKAMRTFSRKARFSMGELFVGRQTSPDDLKLLFRRLVI
jgi:hypothetical protein